MPLTVVLMSVLGGTRHWAGPGDRRGRDHRPSLQLHRRRQRPRRQGRDRRDPDRCDPVHARRHPAAPPAGVAAPRASERGGRAPGRRHRRAAARDAQARTRRRQPARSCLRVTGLHKRFKGVRALAGVEVEVRRGEILGLLGPNGSGKSTFINVVSGHYAPTAGEIVFEGHALERRAAHRIAAAGIARTYQIPRPFAHMNVLDNVALAAMFGAGIRTPRRGARRGAPMARVHRPRRQGRRAARRAQPAPAQVPRARARARVAAAPRAARRGAVRADAERDRRRGRSDPQRIRDQGVDHRLRRARDARGDGAHRPRRRLPPRRAARRGPRRRRDAAPRGDDRVPRHAPMLEVHELQVCVRRGASALGRLARASRRRAALGRRPERRRQDDACQRDRRDRSRRAPGASSSTARTSRAGHRIASAPPASPSFRKGGASSPA